MEVLDPLKRGFTLLETLTCISIVVIVSALAFPMFSSVKRYSKRTAAASHLKQLHVAVALYRTEEGKDGVYGEPSQMGLPTDEGPYPSPYVVFMSRYRAFKRSPCGFNRNWVPDASEEPLQTIYYRPSEFSTFGKYAAKYQGNSLLFCDYNCDEPETPFENKYLRHYGVGVLVEGQLVTPYKPGLMRDDAWWSTPPGE
jgi:prepilin-type N-terminal cleavage/methylation domain-containing protein